MSDKQKEQFSASHPATWFSQSDAETIGLVAVVLHQLGERCEDLGGRHVVAAVLCLPQLVVLDHPVVQHYGDRMRGPTSETVNAD